MRPRPGRAEIGVAMDSPRHEQGMRARDRISGTSLPLLMQACECMQRPHPEGRPQHGVSKDGPNRRSPWPSFETPASQAPQDEVLEEARQPASMPLTRPDALAKDILPA